ncbi:hypothetical protein [Kitasatospora sp. NPDC086791]|uniref:hypothetical protein n=1 Tax=Kitasatospora sp. NPDC086791 TaxID=3155178 RepID=UPI0034438467
MARWWPFGRKDKGEQPEPTPPAEPTPAAPEAPEPVAETAPETPAPEAGAAAPKKAGLFGRLFGRGRKKEAEEAGEEAPAEAPPAPPAPPAQPPAPPAGAPGEPGGEEPAAGPAGGGEGGGEGGEGGEAAEEEEEEEEREYPSSLDVEMEGDWQISSTLWNGVISATLHAGAVKRFVDAMDKGGPDALEVAVHLVCERWSRNVDDQLDVKRSVFDMRYDESVHD